MKEGIKIRTNIVKNWLAPFSVNSVNIQLAKSLLAYEWEILLEEGLCNLSERSQRLY